LFFTILELVWNKANGEMGKQGIHQVDVLFPFFFHFFMARWGLGVSTRPTITGIGGPLMFDARSEDGEDLTPRSIRLPGWYKRR